MLDWIIEHNWIIPLAVTVFFAVSLWLLLRSIESDDAGPDGAAEMAVIMMALFALTGGVWFLWLVCKIMF